MIYIIEWITLDFKMVLTVKNEKKKPHTVNIDKSWPRLAVFLLIQVKERVELASFTLCTSVTHEHIGHSIDV